MNAFIKPLLLSLLIVGALSLTAQNRYNISGVIIDQDNRPLELATVRVGGSMIGAVSDLKGAFNLWISSQTDSVELHFSCLGYKKQTRTLHSLTGNVKITIRMYSSVQNLQEVAVTEYRRQSSTLQSIDIKNSRSMPDATGGSIESILSTFAGVHSNNELSTQYSVRGGSYDENLVYVNGIEIYRPLLIRAGQQEGLSFINPDMVESVQFSSGGYDAQYGDRISSVLDITYKQPKRTEATASLSLMGGSVYIGSHSNQFTQLHGIRYKTNTMLLGTLQTKGEYNPWFIDYQTQLSYRFSPQWDISFIGNFSQNSYHFVPTNRNTQFGSYADAKSFTVYFDGQEKDMFRTYFGALTLNHVLSSKVNLSFMASAFATDEQETYDISGEYWLNDAQTTDTPSEEPLGVGAYLQHARNFLHSSVMNFSQLGSVKWDQHHLKWGVSLQHESITDRQKEWEMRDSSGYSLPHRPESVEVIYNLSSKNNLSSNRAQAFLQDVFKFRTEKGLFAIHAGIRASYWDFNNELIVSPRASASFIPSKNQNWTFRLASGIYHQAPFYKELRNAVIDANQNTSIQLNNHIRSPRSIHFVAGADYNFRWFDRPFRFTTEIYYKHLTDLIPYTVDNVRISYYGKNMAHGYTTGVDLKLFGEFVPGTDSWLSFSWMKAKENIGGKWIPRPNEQRYSISLFFQDYIPKHPEYKIHLKAVYADGLTLSPPLKGREQGVFRTPAYKRIDIGASRLLVGESKLMQNKFFSAFKSIWIGIDIFNLLDINNINSYFWITDIYNQQYAVPNYLTSRQFNLRLSAEF